MAQFARFSPQTAADVVAQIPGFSVTNVSNDRGLGEASQNVLINGQRITGKGNDANAVLRRIPGQAPSDGWRSWTGPCWISAACPGMC